MQDMRYELEHGLYGKSDKVKMNKWFEIWIEEYKSNTVKESTMNHFRTYYRLYIQPDLGNTYLSDIKPIQIQKIYNKMAKDGYKTNTIKKVNNILHSMFNESVKNDMLLKNPCSAIVVPKTEAKERRVLTMQEQQRFLDFLADGCRYSGYRNLFEVAFGTGLRIGELLALNWNDIDFFKKVIHVNKTIMYIQNPETRKCHFKIQTPKTKTSNRSIPMIESVQFYLKKQLREQKKRKSYLLDKWMPLQEDGMRSLVFTTEFGTPISQMSINRTITSIVNEINKQNLNANEESKRKILDNFTPHAIRHSFATRCFEMGIPPKVVQEFLGHSSLNMTMDLYTHVMEETKKK